jgi:hypothetical protein
MKMNQLTLSTRKHNNNDNNNVVVVVVVAAVVVVKAVDIKSHLARQ